MRPTQYGIGEQPLLLDTHAWIWWLEDDVTRMAAGTATLLERVEAVGNLLVSDVSYWEVAVKAAKGKLSLSLEATEWLQRAERAPGIRTCPLSREVLLRSTRLVGALHNDPADRMLIATAQLLCVPLVTADRTIIAYAKAHTGIQVVDIRR